jgi:hypothetical protein
MGTVSECSSSLSRSGHISGTLHRELPRTVENCRDLSRRSTGMHGIFPLVKKTDAQDPACRPTGEGVEVAVRDGDLLHAELDRQLSEVSSLRWAGHPVQACCWQLSRL